MPDQWLHLGHYGVVGRVWNVLPSQIPNVFGMSTYYKFSFVHFYSSGHIVGFFSLSVTLTIGALTAGSPPGPEDRQQQWRRRKKKQKKEDRAEQAGRIREFREEVAARRKWQWQRHATTDAVQEPNRFCPISLPSFRFFVFVCVSLCLSVCVGLVTMKPEREETERERQRCIFVVMVLAPVRLNGL